MTNRMPVALLVLFVIACGLIALADATAQPRAAVAAAGAPAQVFGDGDHNGQVDFNDITAALSNWLFGVNLAPGETAPPPPVLLSAWAQQRVLKVHPMSIEDLESPEYTMTISRGSAGQTAYDMGLDARFVGGVKGRGWPGGAPPWPPPGSALEELMEVWAADVGEWNHEQVEAAAQAVINQLLAARAKKAVKR